MKGLVLFLVGCFSCSAWAGMAPFPYGCPQMPLSEGYYWIYDYYYACSLRQAPEAIEKCKQRGADREAPYFENIEKSAERACYQRNGRLTSSWCLTGNTFETGSPSSLQWNYQSAKVFECRYN